MAERNSAFSATEGSRPAGMDTRAGGSASGLAEKVRERAKEQISSQKDRATDSLGSVAQAVRQSTQQLRDQQHETLAGYVEQAADQIDRFSRALRGKDVGELMSDAQRLARRRPALFVGSAFALGLAGARFFKSSPPEESRGYDTVERYGSSRFGEASSPGAYAATGTSPARAAGGASGLTGRGSGVAGSSRDVSGTPRATGATGTTADLEPRSTGSPVTGGRSRASTTTRSTPTTDSERS